MIDGSSAKLLHVHGMELLVASAAMRALMQTVERVAASNVVVLITGETGCGKELIARAIHAFSPRANGPWVDVNCAALPEHLIESELFGYEKGAFSGADATKAGMFELAHRGTLFLDEVGELDIKGQVKLLRVLDGMPYYRLGGSRKVSMDVRVVAATNRGLEDGVRQGRLRRDLYHRLSQFQIRVPALRERPDDIGPLAEHFVRQTQPGLKFSFGAMEALRSYGWPGNVRELKNVVVQTAMKATSGEIRRADLPPEVTAQPRNVETADADPGERGDPGPAALDELEKQAILRAMARTGGHQGMAAEQLGVSRRTLSRRLKQYGIEGRPNGGSWRGMRETQFFRMPLAVPVAMASPQAEQVATSVDVSAGGIGVEGVQNPFQLAAGLKVSFSLPDDNAVITARAHIIWADPSGRVGLRFAEMADTSAERLTRWLDEQRRLQGKETTGEARAVKPLTTGFLATRRE
jgi:DNA-binding NtrC family response regulator